ncbi:MAG: Ig-like domain-containing protein [Deltaproteobacteria bacterium]|nr:Ig-like domain-containing protein [Deltaproteobacteria bacterium]
MTLAAGPALAQDGGTLPVSTYQADQLYTHISPTIGEGKAQNQPSIINGYLLLAGNAHFELWDIADPFAPRQLSTFDSPYNISEAESHQVATRHTAEGRWQVVTISGWGVDLWDVTDPEAPELLSAVLLDGIDYGDNSEAVWGVAWQGDTVWVGGTNTGLHVLDTTDPRNPTLVQRIPTTAFGGISAGPLWAVGDVLVMTTPKDHAGIVTLDISDPQAPAVLDFVVPEEDSYIGGLYGTNMHLLSPFRTYDVLTDPANITLLGSYETESTEYLSFGDGKAFVGRLRPNPGAYELDLADPNTYAEVAYLEGRRDDIAQGFFTDDQFTLPVGNLLVLGDDETRYGAVLVVRALQSDSVPPRVSAIRPADGSTGVSTRARIGVSLTDQIDLRSATQESVILRPALGGPPVTGDWDLTHTVLGFSPHEPLDADTAYEIVLPAGGLQDISGNGLALEATAAFSTGSGAPPPSCGITTAGGVEVGAPATLTAAPTPGARWSWDFGDGVSTGQAFETSVTHAWGAPGRWPVTLTVHGKSGARSCTAIQVVHRPLLPAPPPVAGPIAVDNDRGIAWVANADAGTLARVDLSDWSRLTETPVGDDPRSVALTDDGVVVALRGEDALVLLDGEGAVTGRVELGWGAMPWAVAVRGGVAWVTLEGASAVMSVNLSTGAVAERLDFPPDEVGGQLRPRGLALHPDGRVFASRFLSPLDRGEVLVIPGEGAVAIPLAMDEGPDEDDGGRGVPNLIAHVALSPDGGRLAVPSNKANVQRGLARDGEPLNPQNTVRSIVSIVDVDRMAESQELRQDLDDHDSPWASVWSPAGDLLFVASRGTNRVDVLDVDAGRQIAGLATGLAPTGLALAGSTLLVHDSLDRTLTAIDVSGLLDGSDASAPRVAVVDLLETEPLAADVLLGKRIFTNGSTRQMSQDGYLSCATCHPDGGSDERVWDFTDRGEGLRNTIDLRGRAGAGHGLIHWSGNFDEVQDFENDMRAHFGGSGFMADEDFAAEGRDDPLGAPKAGVSPELDALSAYVTSLDRYPRSPFRAADGSLTLDGERGRRIFERLDCVECHTGEDFTDSIDAERHDVGTLSDASGQRRGGALDGLDTPTLHGLHASGPYLHDGSAPTLENTLRIEGHGDAQSLSRQSMDRLVSYLLQLDGSVDEPTTGCLCTSPGAPLSSAWLALIAAVAGVGLRRRR